jgi:hypothetical protein
MRLLHVRIAAAVAFTAVATILAAPARADRLAPYATREATLGCWDVGGGATLRLTPFGKHSVRYRASFARRPRGGPAVMTGTATFASTAGEYELPCRPRSIHGGFCRVAPDGAGGLQVRVFAFRHGDRTHGVLRETLTATRCRRP